MEVTLATTDDGLRVTSNGCDSVTFKGVKTQFFPSDFGESFKYSRRLAKWLDQNVAQFDLVHIHAVFNHSSIAAARACTKHHIPYIIRPLGSLDPWGMQQKRYRKSLYWKIVGDSMCRRSAAMQYTTTQEKQASEGLLALNHGTVIPLGIQDFPAQPLNELNEDLQIGKPYILVLSRIVPTKGIDVLLSSFLTVVDLPAFSNWRLVIAGNGPEDYVSELKGMVRNSGRDQSVVFTGWLDENRKYRVLRSAALLALPSYHENFGLCVMEALACSVPVLVSPHVGLANEIASHGAGWVVSIDHERIVKALTEALGNEESLIRKGAAARQLSRQFAWRVVGKQLEALYQSVVTNSVQARV